MNDYFTNWLDKILNLIAYSISFNDDVDDDDENNFDSDDVLQYFYFYKKKWKIFSITFTFLLPNRQFFCDCYTTVHIKNK